MMAIFANLMMGSAAPQGDYSRQDCQKTVLSRVIKRFEDHSSLAKLAISPMAEDILMFSIYQTYTLIASCFYELSSPLNPLSIA